MNNKLVWAPVDLKQSALRILDSGTADGVWIRDLQSDLEPDEAQHTYVGIDIEGSYFPSGPPKNTSYHVQDINGTYPAEWKGSFDLIHQRLTLCVSGGVESTSDAVRKQVELLKPGGWIQYVEVQGWTADSDGRGWKDFTTCVAELVASVGSSVTHIDRAKGWLLDLGLVDVEEVVLEGNFGTRDDKELETLAKKSALLTAQSILGVAQTFPQELLSLPLARIPQIKTDLEKEMNTEPTNAHWHYKVVWGKKPQ
ncbi:hypothetical protein F5B22DRAFT_141990 [Xylaria bambusicola]|uniref:uncharacterized protein n=1 Tax=Xylaria bambusicola TaxID=326684 RepID=UPI0020086B4F|nr:uncharacterized protein F5B22DRAFT_141990 [Xylaria bambusicola]KAI0517004.1 hypothetical protein F5B22DRAFT_141990 [Xylaria bambusicola]